MSDSSVLDISIIDEVKMLMKDKFPPMVQYFLEDSKGYVAAIRDGVESGNVEKITVPAHTLKSSARQMGALRVSDISKIIEEKAREQSSVKRNDVEPFKALLADLEVAYAEMDSAYQQYKS